MANAWLAHVKSTMKAHMLYENLRTFLNWQKTYKKSGTAAKKTTKKGKKGKKRNTGKRSKRGKKRMRGGEPQDGSAGGGDGDQDGGNVNPE